MNWLDAPLLRALRSPAQMHQFSEADWDLAVRQARATGLLGRLGQQAMALASGLALPARVLRHFTAWNSMVALQHNAVRWEVRQIAKALATTDTPVVLLKGAAYAAADGPAAVGRTFSDVDILVPRESLGAVEHALEVGGWVTASTSAYDQRYYRQWMHELPPMVHVRRGTSLDVHHDLLPRTARLRTRPELVLAQARPLPGWPRVLVPSATDQILHSACHLFHEGEWGNGLRDLSDLDLMLRAFGAAGGTAAQLEERAGALNLLLPLAYAVRYCASVFHTPLPQGLAHALARRVRRPWMDALFMRALASAHGAMAPAGTGLALQALYVRSHWLRMPLHLLLPHLVHQAMAKRQARQAV